MRVVIDIFAVIGFLITVYAIYGLIVWLNSDVI